MGEGVSYARGTPEVRLRAPAQEQAPSASAFVHRRPQTTLRPYTPLEPRYPHLRWDAGAPASVRRVSTRRASARRASLRRASVRPCVAAAALLIDGLLQRARRPDVHHTLRGELVLMAHRLLCDSTLGSRVLKKKEEDTMREGRVLRGWALGMRKTGTWFRDWGLRVRMSL